MELEQRIEVLKECREAQAELRQAVAQRRGGGRSPERRPGSEARGVELKERAYVGGGGFPRWSGGS